MDELTLYQTDRPAWLAIVGPRYAAQLTAMNGERIRKAWGELPRDYQEAVWAHLDEATRVRVRKARAA